MDMVSCKVQLGADPGNVAVRGPFEPVSWPEVSILQSIHGEESVYDIEFVSVVKTTAVEEKSRLVGIYGKDAVDLVFPGSRPNIEGQFPGDRPGVDTPQAAALKSGKTVRAAPVKTPVPKGKDTMTAGGAPVDADDEGP